MPKAADFASSRALATRDWRRGNMKPRQPSSSRRPPPAKKRSASCEPKDLRCAGQAEPGRGGDRAGHQDTNAERDGTERHRQQERPRPCTSCAPVGLADGSFAWLGPYLCTGALLADSQNQRTLGGDDDGVLILRRAAPVGGAHGPTVGILLDPRGSGGHEAVARPSREWPAPPPDRPGAALRARRDHESTCRDLTTRSRADEHPVTWFCHDHSIASRAARRPSITAPGQCWWPLSSE